MNFAFKEKYQRIFVRPREEVGFAMWFAGFLAAGGAAGATALTVSYPLEYTYTRLAADTGGGHGHGSASAGAAAPPKRQFKGIADCLVQTVRSDGLRGVYRGYGPSVAGIVVYRAGLSLTLSLSLSLSLSLTHTHTHTHTQHQPRLGMSAHLPVEAPPHLSQ